MSFWERAWWITAAVIGVALVIAAIASVPRPVPCLASHVERRHVPAHDETMLLPTMEFNGEMGMHFVTTRVAARDVTVVICDRYAAERP